MSKDTLALILNGDVSLAEYATAIEHLSAMIKNLAEEVAKGVKIEWEIAQLKSSSPTTIVRGYSANLADVEKVVQAFGVVGQYMKDGQTIPYSESVAKEARAITGILNGKVKSVEFKTDAHDSMIDRVISEVELPSKNVTFGTVTGYVETISKHERLRIVVYDTLFNRAVDCYITDRKMKHQMLDSWEKRVTVGGEIHRDFQTGKPICVYNVRYIKVHKDMPPGGFMAARGVIPWKEGDELPEQKIRQLRDAG
jgi:hypothetical protein